MKLLVAFLKNNQGATAIEYALIGTLVSVGIIGGLQTFSSSTNNLYTSIVATVQGA